MISRTPLLVPSSTHCFCVLILILICCLSTTESFENPFRLSGKPSQRLSNYFQNSKNNEMKAWTCHGRNQLDLVDRMVQAGIVQTPAVRKVLELVDRANFIPRDPHIDAPQSIGLGQTISAPHMHAHALEEIYPYLAGKEDLKLLDVGVGSGYLTAAFGRWIQTPPSYEGEPILGSNVTGKVFGIDVHQDLVDLSTRNIEKADADLIDSGIIKTQVGNGWRGLSSEAPFDVIHVGAAADGLPYELLSQLKVGGVMIVPIGAQSQMQNLYKIERISSNGNATTGFDANDYRITTLLGVRYVPLVDKAN